MKILFINNDGGGFADTIEIDAGLTVRTFFARQVPHGKPDQYTIRVNRLPTSSDYVLASPELAGEGPVLVGRTAQHLALKRGPWTISFRLETQGRFPKVEDVIPRDEHYGTRVTLAPADLAFLRENLGRLPGAEQDSSPVTLDLNGAIAIRARGEPDSPPTELVLTNSAKTGSDLRLRINRQLLSRAIRLGLPELWFVNPEATVQCRDTTRSYVCMPLHPDGAIPASPDTIVIPSPAATAEKVLAQRVAAQPVTQEKPVPETTSTPAADAPAPVRAPGSKRRRNKIASSQAELLEQSFRLRTHLREGLVQLNALIGAIKRQRRQERLVKSTLESLKQLQAA